MIASIEPQRTFKSSKLQGILDDILAKYTRDGTDSLKGAAFVAVDQKGMVLGSELMDIEQIADLKVSQAKPSSQDRPEFELLIQVGVNHLSWILSCGSHRLRSCSLP